ncbi:DUF262 domain-containing protein [Phytohabitans suffuscus]|uniref:DUF262 domain-containing protein n=1 Tax=Phytohabitans suffuscus TaxID=624315 RepID=A0A6F8YKM3_9ACTN|nr:DUF262 domain-containing protein [Phytohabitans suffuscus]BCB86616.1 hypothetical protein Psuf_039290 [Phytohabitans suffuscus]
MKPDTRTARELFQADVRYLVPLYQRSYVWQEEDQWQPLWEDIEVILDHRLNGGDDNFSHFLGAIVLEQPIHTPGTIPTYTVIDGQQRLTTLQLVLAAAGTVAAEVGAARDAALLAKLTYNDDLTAEGEERFKVWPTNADRAAFQTVMSQDPPIAGHHYEPGNRIEQACTFFRTTMRKWIEEAGDETAQQRRTALLRVTLSDLLKLVSITLEPGDNAQIIFETLNARGTPLLALDLVKNAIFHAATRQKLKVDQLYDEVWRPQLDQNHWQQMQRQGRLNRPRADLFLMHWLGMKLQEVVPATELFTRFRQRILDRSNPPDAGDLVRELCRDAEILRSFDHQPPGSVEATFFDRLGVLDTSAILPLVLLLFRDQRVSVDRRRRALKVLESWLVRRSLMRLTVKNYNQQVPAMLKRIANDPERADEVLIDHLRSGVGQVSRWPTDRELTQYLTTRPMYGSIAAPRLVMALAAVEQSLYAAKVDIPQVPKGLSLEHVMPREWEPHWPLPTDIDEAEATRRRDDHLHRLGNLTLVAGPLNSAMSNDAWPAKQAELNKHSKLLINVELTREYGQFFDETAIDERSELLGNRICAIWPGPHAWVHGS